MIIFHALRTQKYKICSSENRSKLYEVHWLKPEEGRNYTPSIAFWHLPPSSARIGYATEGALFISAQLSTDAVSALRKVWVLLRLWKEHIAFKQSCKHETHPLRVKKKKKLRLYLNDFGFIWSQLVPSMSTDI